MLKTLKIGGNSKLEWIGTEGALLEHHDYLFITKKGEEPFIEIQKSMQELNDFCVTLLRSVKSAAIDEQFNHDVNLASAYEDGLEGFDSYYALSELAYSCEDFGRIYTPASAVLLLYATLVRSLNAIARYYGEEKCKQFDSVNKRRVDELPKLNELLESICSKKIEVFHHPQVNALITTQARLLRNNFIHGDWSAVEKALLGINIRNCFTAVSFIFSELEELFDEEKIPRANKSIKLA